MTVVRARVVLDGRPAGGARADAFRIEDGRPLAASVAGTVLDADGRFTLRLGEPGDHVIAVLASGARPLALTLTAWRERAIDLGTHLAERGHAIDGEARRLGAPHAGLGVAAELVSLTGVDVEPAHALPSGHRARWVDGRFEWSSLAARAGLGGRFRLGGLAEAVYRLHVADVPGALGALARKPAYREVTAPFAGLALELDSCLVTLELDGSARGSPGRVRVRSDGAPEASFAFADGAQPLTLLAPAHARLELAVELDGRATAPLVLVAPGPGEELRRTL